MAENSRIEWTDHTFNPWWGCTKVSPACDNCYAEAWAKRTGHNVWGARSERRFLTDFYWKQPIRWNRHAERRGVRERVFCASMADVFEWRSDLRAWRHRLWEVIEATPNLDWLLLTKRPHLVDRLVPWSDDWPDNVWLGTTVETQRWARKRLPVLSSSPARVKFISCEPLLGRLNLDQWFGSGSIDWVITGGESGSHARPSDPMWFYDLRDQCSRHGVAFHFKQWGDWAPVGSVVTDLLPTSVVDDLFSTPLARYGKRRSGRLLDGRYWDELPQAV